MGTAPNQAKLGFTEKDQPVSLSHVDKNLCDSSVTLTVDINQTEPVPSVHIEVGLRFK